MTTIFSFKGENPNDDVVDDVTGYVSPLYEKNDFILYYGHFNRNYAYWRLKKLFVNLIRCRVVYEAWKCCV